MPALPDARLAELAAHAVGATQRGLPSDLRALARGVIVHYETLPDATVIVHNHPYGASLLAAMRAGGEWRTVVGVADTAEAHTIAANNALTPVLTICILSLLNKRPPILPMAY